VTALDDLETAATSTEHISGHVHGRFGLIMLEGYSSGAIPAASSANGRLIRAKNLLKRAPPMAGNTVRSPFRIRARNCCAVDFRHSCGRL
jgi:hypothetical protein